MIRQPLGHQSDPPPLLLRPAVSRIAMMARMQTTSISTKTAPGQSCTRYKSRAANPVVSVARWMVSTAPARAQPQFHQPMRKMALVGVERTASLQAANDHHGAKVV